MEGSSPRPPRLHSPPAQCKICKDVARGRRATAQATLQMRLGSTPGWCLCRGHPEHLPGACSCPAGRERLRLPRCSAAGGDGLQEDERSPLLSAEGKPRQRAASPPRFPEKNPMRVSFLPSSKPQIRHSPCSPSASKRRTEPVLTAGQPAWDRAQPGGSSRHLLQEAQRESSAGQGLPKGGKRGTEVWEEVS